MTRSPPGRRGGTGVMCRPRAYENALAITFFTCHTATGSGVPAVTYTSMVAEGRMPVKVSACFCT